MLPKNIVWFGALVLGCGMVGGMTAAGWALIILFTLKVVLELI